MKAWFPLVLLACGCLKPSPGNGAILCGPGGSCPDDYYCEPTTSSCWKNGEAPGGTDLSAALDLAGADLTPSGAPVGSQCSNNGDCATALCIDGYCCDQKCDGSCVACNLPGTEGTCTPVALGQSPHHGSCGPDAMTSCMRNGLCDGNGACQLWTNTTVCKPSACNTGTNLFTPPSTCDGKGACVTPTAITCAPYLCKDTVTCYASCTMTTGQCQSPNTCNSMSCGPKPLGAQCGTGTECASTYCVDGVCCDGACTGQCEACVVGGSSGHCLPVTGAPIAPRTKCATDGTVCGGACNGTNRAACAFPTNTLSCATAVCSGNNALTKYICNGAGACTSSAVTCGYYACNPNVLPAACYAGDCMSAGAVCATGISCCPELGGKHGCDACGS
jgi:hypothetical protein